MAKLISYSSTRLQFKADEIESLDMEDMFEIITPDATWRMTKADFYRVFPNVVASCSYTTRPRHYHYPKTPRKADIFRI